MMTLGKALAYKLVEDRRMKWISVEDRLPEDSMPVIAYIADRGSIIVTVYCGDFALIRCSSTTGFSPHKVTHWMPLPEPPKDK